MKKEEVSGLPKKVLTQREAGEYLSVSPLTVARWTKEGKLTHVRMGRLIRYRLEDLDAFLEENASQEWKDFVPERGQKNK